MTKLFIGIDPGVHTGIAIYDKENRQLELKTVMIHQGFDVIRQYKDRIKIVVIENPNLWTHFTDQKAARAKLQGAGSVKRDFKAWEDFLKDEKIEYRSVRPDKTRNKLATNRTSFIRITGYTKLCSEHSRVAAMLVAGL